LQHENPLLFFVGRDLAGTISHGKICTAPMITPRAATEATQRQGLA
jgi:hypothetical protein